MASSMTPRARAARKRAAAKLRATAQAEREYNARTRRPRAYDPMTASTCEQTTSTLLAYVFENLESRGIELGSELADLINALAQDGSGGEAIDELMRRARNNGGI